MTGGGRLMPDGGRPPVRVDCRRERRCVRRWRWQSLVMRVRVRRARSLAGRSVTRRRCRRSRSASRSWPRSGTPASSAVARLRGTRGWRRRRSRCWGTCGGGGGGRSGLGAAARRATPARSRSWSWGWRRSWAGATSPTAETRRRSRGSSRRTARACSAGLTGSSTPGSSLTRLSRTRRGSGGGRSSSCTPARSCRRSCSRRPCERRAGWPERERRRQARGRRRDLTAILRRARLSRSERRARALLRRQLLERHAERQRVRQAVADSLAQTVRSHLRHPFGASTTSRTSLEEVSQDETSHRGLTRAPALVSEPASAKPRQTPVTQREAARTGEETRWAVYNEILAARFARSDQEWEPFLSATGASRRGAAGLARERRLPAVAADRGLDDRGARSAHGPRRRISPRVLVRAGRASRPTASAGAGALPSGSPTRARRGGRRARWPALARFLSGHVRRQDGPEHGMAYDVQRFNELTKQMSAYAHYQRGRAPRAGRQARRPPRASGSTSSPSRSTSGCASGSPSTGPEARLRTARAGCWTQSIPTTRPPVGTCTRGAMRERRSSRARPAAARRPAPRRHRRPLPRRVRPRAAVGAFAAARTVAGGVWRWQ